MKLSIYPRLYSNAVLKATVTVDGYIILDGQEIKMPNFCTLVRSIDKKQRETLKTYFDITYDMLDRVAIEIHPEFSVMRTKVTKSDELFFKLIPLPVRRAPGNVPLTCEAILDAREIQKRPIVWEPPKIQKSNVVLECTGKCGRKTRRIEGTVFRCKRCNLQPSPF